MGDSNASGGLDARLIPLFLAAGWLLVTLGIWGACGQWWVWPLSFGIASSAVGAAYGWAMWRQLLRIAPPKPDEAARFEQRSA